MVVWGGGDFAKVLNTGGRYDPVADSWTATSLTNAPTARAVHTAVWTGTEMIVWGGTTGLFAFLNTGGNYNPNTNSWTATSMTNAPTARYVHTAVWTGTEMIVWGGTDDNLVFFTGGRYNPGADSWIATSTTSVPTGRSNHTAVWTDAGGEMIVWGGITNFFLFLNTGGRYSPGTNSWTATTTTSAPDARLDHTAVWTGNEMIVWGGQGNSGSLNTGGRYCAQAGGAIALSTAKRKLDGINTVRLTWSGATSTDIDVYRCTLQMGACDLELIATTPNNGSYTDSTGDTARAGYHYRVCEAGTMNCSDEVTVRFQH
jgi:hypothetical protein